MIHVKLWNEVLCASGPPLLWDPKTKKLDFWTFLEKKH